MADLLTPSQVAEMLGVTEKRLIDWRYRGEGPDYVKLGHRTVRYRREDLDRWISQRVEKASR